MIQFDQIQNVTREGWDAALRSLGALTAGGQAAATQVADFARHNVEQGSQAAERLMGVRSLDAAMQVQGEYLRTSYEGLVAQATKMGDLASRTAKEAFAPVEGFAARSLKTAA